MGQAMKHDRMYPGVGRDDLEAGTRRRIPFEHTLDILTPGGSMRMLRIGRGF
jgi:hypothetical protein